MDRIVIEFTSEEQDFIYNFGVNKGHSISHSKLNRCLFLSSDAKQLHHNISDYAYRGGRESFPGQATLRNELGWHRSQFAKALKELRDKGLIITEKKAKGNGLIYKIRPLNEVSTIIHSEIVYVQRDKVEDFHSIVNEYKKTDLFKKADEEPFKYLEEIQAYFSGKCVEDVVEETKEDEVVKEESKKEEPNPKPTHSSKPNTEIPLPRIIGATKREKLKRESGGKGVRRKKATIQSPIEEWTLVTFEDYFEQLYRDKFERPYLTLKGDRAQLRRVLDAKDNETVKQDMENFMELDVFESKTVRAFGSTYSQSVLDRYAVDGTVPGKKLDASDLEVDEDWGSQLDKLIKGD